MSASRPTFSRRTLAALTLSCSMLTALTTPLTSVNAAEPVPSAPTVLVVGASAEAASASVRRAGGRVLAAYPIASAVSAQLPRGTGVTGARVVANVALTVASEASSTSSGQDAHTLVNASSTAAGQGVIVAVVDTGVADVAQLREAVVGRVDLTGEGAGDGYGHGTFMAGLIAAAGESGRGRGVAPGAQILDVRVADSTGGSDLLKVLGGLQAVSDARAADPRVRVMNLSMSVPSNGLDAPAAMLLGDALASLQEEGVSVVVPAGNEGPRPGSLTAPGSTPALLTAGALDTTGSPAVAAFSGQGVPSPRDPRQVDLVAPGVSVLGVRAPGSTVDQENPQARVGEELFRGSGTSMSSAVTAGAAAVVIGTQPSLSPGQVAASLTLSAQPVAGASREAAGAGRVDLERALAAAAQLAASGGDAPTSAAHPDAGDAERFAEFTRAWEAGDAELAARAWSALAPSTQAWTARAWSEMVWSSGHPELAARAWSARAWSSEEWVARAWSGRSWIALDWAARAWSARAWSGRAWSGRAWSGRAWSGRAWSSDEWAGRAWSGRAWSSDEWAGRAWSGRAWSTLGWV